MFYSSWVTRLTRPCCQIPISIPFPLSLLAMQYPPTQLPDLTHNFASTYPHFCQYPPTMLPILTQKFAKPHPQFYPISCQDPPKSLQRPTHNFASTYPQCWNSVPADRGGRWARTGPACGSCSCPGGSSGSRRPVPLASESPRRSCPS